MQQLLHDGDLALDVLKVGLRGLAVLLLVQEVLGDDLDREQFVRRPVFT